MLNVKPVSLFLGLLLVPMLALAYTPGSKAPRGSGKVLESGMEGPFYDFSLGADLHGQVKTKVCASDTRCKEIIIKISPDVRATLDEQEVPLSLFVNSKQQPVSLHINNDTQKLGRIRWLSSHNK